MSLDMFPDAAIDYIINHQEGECMNDQYKDEDVDSSPAEPVEEGVDESLSDDPTDNVSEGKSADDADLAEDELKHVDDAGSVIGRRNPDLPTENLSVPDANPSN